MIKDKKDIRDTNEEVTTLNWYVKNNKSKIAYLGINALGWAKKDTIEECIDDIKSYSRKWSDVDARDLPYRIFMILNNDTSYEWGMGTEILGKSDEGFQSILIEDTHDYS